jgi:hypothetical protein
MIYNFSCLTFEQNGSIHIKKEMKIDNKMLKPKLYANKCLALSILDGLNDIIEENKYNDMEKSFLSILYYLENKFGDEIFDSDINNSHDVYELLLNIANKHNVYIVFIPCIKNGGVVFADTNSIKTPINIGNINDIHMYIAMFSDTHFEAIRMKSIVEGKNDEDIYSDTSDRNISDDDDYNDDILCMQIYNNIKEIMKSLSIAKKRMDEIERTVNFLKTRNKVEILLMDTFGNTTFRVRVVLQQQNISQITNILDSIKKFIDMIEGNFFCTIIYKKISDIF